MKLTKSEIGSVASELSFAEDAIERLQKALDRPFLSMRSYRDEPVDVEDFCKRLEAAHEAISDALTLVGTLMEDWACDEDRPALSHRLIGEDPAHVDDLVGMYEEDPDLEAQLINAQEEVRRLELAVADEKAGRGQD